MSDSRILRTLVCDHERYSELMHQIAHEPYIGEYGRTLGDDVFSCCLAEHPTPDCQTPLKTAADRLFNPQPHQTHPNLAPDLLNFAWAPAAKPIAAETAGTVISGEVAAALGVGAWIFLGVGLLVASSPAPGEPGLLKRQETHTPPWIPSVGFLPSLLDDDNLPAMTAESSGNNSFPPLDILTPQATRQPSGPLFVVSTGSGIHFSPEEDDDESQLKRFAEELRRTRNIDMRKNIAAAIDHLNQTQRAVLLTKLAICIIQIFAEQEDSLPGDDISEDNHLLTDMEQILSQITWLLKNTHAHGTEKQLNHDFASSLDTFMQTEQGRRTSVMSEITAGAVDTSEAHEDLTEVFGKVRITVRNREIAVTRYQRELANKFVEYLLRGQPRLEWNQRNKTCKLFYPQDLPANTKIPTSSLHNSPFPPDSSDPIVAAYLQVLGWKLELAEEREYVWSF